MQAPSSIGCSPSEAAACASAALLRDVVSAVSSVAPVLREEAPEQALLSPLVVFPRGRSARGALDGDELRAVIERYLPRFGAILLRGFSVSEDRDFEALVASQAEPRSAARWAPRIWAWYAAVPGVGEHVQLADRREIARRVPARLRRRWADAGVRVQLGGECARVTPADGAELDELDAHELCRAVEDCTTRVPWESRDVLLLDTALTVHAFQPGSVDRKICVLRELRG